ncbi:hypothetical protein AGIG_G18367 [Arapaima gigas]
MPRNVPHQLADREDCELLCSDGSLADSCRVSVDVMLQLRGDLIDSEEEQASRHTCQAVEAALVPGERPPLWSRDPRAGCSLPFSVGSPGPSCTFSSRHKSTARGKWGRMPAFIVCRDGRSWETAGPRVPRCARQSPIIPAESEAFEAARGPFPRSGSTEQSLGTADCSDSGRLFHHHAVVRVEGNSHHPGQLPTALHPQVPAPEVLSPQLLQAHLLSGPCFGVPR